MQNIDHGFPRAAMTNACEKIRLPPSRVCRPCTESTPERVVVTVKVHDDPPVAQALALVKHHAFRELEVHRPPRSRPIPCRNTECIKGPIWTTVTSSSLRILRRSASGTNPSPMYKARIVDCCGVIAQIWQRRCTCFIRNAGGCPAKYVRLL